MNLRADLRDSFRLARGLGDDARLGNGAGERLLAVEMTSALQRGDGGDGVRVVRRGDDDGVEILLVYESAEIAISLRGRELLGDGRHAAFVDVAERDDVRDVLELPDTEPALAVHADDADVQLVIGGDGALGAQELRRSQPKAGGGCGGAGEELAAGEGVHGRERLGWKRREPPFGGSRWGDLEFLDGNVPERHRIVVPGEAEVAAGAVLAGMRRLRHEIRGG